MGCEGRGDVGVRFDKLNELRDGKVSELVVPLYTSTPLLPGLMSDAEQQTPFTSISSMPTPFALLDMSRPLRLVFMGTPDFAVPSLQALIDGGDEVVGVLSQPDKPAGRRMVLHAPPVKQYALAHDVPVFQPDSIRTREAIERLRTWRPDLIVVAAYGKILPAAVLALPRGGCINVHASLLPKYRGAAPIQWAIARGEAQTGVTIMQINDKMDAGDILFQKTVALKSDETGGSLHDTLAALGARALIEAIAGLKAGKLIAVPQDEPAATYAPRLRKEDGEIDWSQPAVRIERRVRAFHPWPSAYTWLAGKRLKILAAHVQNGVRRDSAAPATVIDLQDDFLSVATGDGNLNVGSVQLQGKKALPIAAFVKGHRLAPGDRLGRNEPL